MADAAAQPLLELDGLTVRLPRGSDRAHAIENITFSVGAGEIVCVVGESGSGKSVTAQAVMGLLPRELAASAGQARVQGEDVLAATPSRLRDLRGRVAQPVVDGAEQLVAHDDVDDGRGGDDCEGDGRGGDEDQAGAEAHGSRRA